MYILTDPLQLKTAKHVFRTLSNLGLESYLFNNLYIAGNPLKHTDVQWLTASDPVTPGDSVTMQCSVLSGAENTICPGDISMFWFTAKSEINCTHGKICNKCMNRSDVQMNCFHHFKNKVISSDDAPFYCAVPLCEEVLFGNGTKVKAGTLFAL